MTKAIFILFTISLFANIADADQILDGTEPPAQACHVRWLFVKDSQVNKNDKGEEETVFTQSNGCSATVIGKREVLISASCIPDVEKSGAYTAQVICDGGQKVLALKNLPQAFPGHDTAKLALNDIAILQTKEEIHIEPAKVPKDQKQWDEIYKGKQCVLFGYGDQVKETEAKPRAIRAYVVPEELARRMKAAGEIPADKSKLVVLTEEAVLPGDTGGGILCKDAKGAWFAMNVTSYIGQPQIQLGTKKLIWFDGKEFKTEKPYIAALTGTTVAATWLDKTMNPKPINPVPQVFGPAFPELPQPRVGSRNKGQRNLSSQAGQ